MTEELLTSSRRVAHSERSYLLASASALLSAWNAVCYAIHAPHWVNLIFALPAAGCGVAWVISARNDRRRQYVGIIRA